MTTSFQSRMKRFDACVRLKIAENISIKIPRIFLNAKETKKNIFRWSKTVTILTHIYFLYLASEIKQIFYHSNS